MSFLSTDCVYLSQEVKAVNLKFTMVMEQELARKLDYIAQYYGRSRIKEIVWACKQYVEQFEKEHGKIELHEE